MKLTFLGTGTSTGVPQLGCHCGVCSSADPHDKRLRCSSLLEIGDKKVIIDCGPDFYVQMLRHGQFNTLDAALITHIHYDHVGGVDDLRPFCSDEGFPFYCSQDVSDGLHHNIPYCFAANPYPGVPHFDIRIIEPFKNFKLFGVDVLPLRVVHARLPILGYMFDSRLAYITDAKTLPQETIDAIRGIDTLVINALRIEPHMSHFSLDEALEIINEVKPHRAYLIHISHHMGLHAEISQTLPESVFLAHDELTIEV